MIPKNEHALLRRAAENHGGYGALSVESTCGANVAGGAVKLQHQGAEADECGIL